jgi:hypothetical protein
LDEIPLRFRILLKQLLVLKPSLSQNSKKAGPIIQQ